MRCSRLILLGLCLQSSCSAVQETWLKPGYDATAKDAVKRIAVVAEPHPAHAGLAELLGQVTKDRVQLKMNYLVYGSAVSTEAWTSHCATPSSDADSAAVPLEGVLLLRALEVDLYDDVRMHLVAELHRCSDQALLWRAVGLEGNAAEDDDLASLTDSYVANLGESIRPFAAPAFLVLRDMLDQLPDVVLSDEEVMEKIELSALPPPFFARR